MGGRRPGPLFLLVANLLPHLGYNLLDAAITPFFPVSFVCPNTGGAIRRSIVYVITH